MVQTSRCQLQNRYSNNATLCLTLSLNALTQSEEVIVSCSYQSWPIGNCYCYLSLLLRALRPLLLLIVTAISIIGKRCCFKRKKTALFFCATKLANLNINTALCPHITLDDIFTVKDSSVRFWFSLCVSSPGS
jgi:hypothetical protein